MVNFIFDSDKKPYLIFGDVENNAFFVNNKGYLCQKIYYDEYNIIADSKGNPYSNHRCSTHYDCRIQRIIGLPTKIEF